MWKAALIVVGGFVLAGALVKLGKRVRREAFLRRVGDTRQLERHVTLRAYIHGARGSHGMDPRRANRSTGDLILTEGSFFLSTSRGVLLQLGPSTGKRFTSVRCTGPGRLVLEGEIPQPGRAPGQIRFEIRSTTPETWVEALRPWTSDKGPYKSLPRTPAVS